MFSSSLRHIRTPNQAVIEQVVTSESITHTSQSGETTTTVRQEQRRVATTAAEGTDPEALKDWLSGTATPPPASSDSSDEDGPAYVVSNAVVQASASGTGLMNKYYYRFDNVRLSRDKITVYYDPDKFTPPTESHWVDIISGNTTSPQYPTMIVLKGDLHNTAWFYLPVEYLPATEHQPKCASWIEPMAYMLQVRYSYNIWHTWNEGIMGLFQTLREQGVLPLASVGPGGVYSEITDGMGEGCPFAYDPELQRVVQEKSCAPREGLLEKSTCNSETDSWCIEGAVVSPRRAGGGPIIVPYTASSVMNVWAHLYSSMTQDVRDWSTIEGSCFRHLIVGKSSTLNFYQAINNTDPDPEVIAKYPRIDNLEHRVEAMAVFKEFVRSAQMEYIDEEEKKGALPWGGYRSRSLERLRQGVGPEDLKEGVLDGINAREVPGMVREERNELRSRWKMHDRLVEKAVERYMSKYGGAIEAFTRAQNSGKAHHDDYDDDYEATAARMKQGKEVSPSNGNAEIEMGDAQDQATEEDAVWRRRRRNLKGSEASSSGGSAGEMSSLGNSGGSSSSSKEIEISSGASMVRRKVLSSDSSIELLGNGGSSSLRTLSAAKRDSKDIDAKKWFDKAAVYRHETPRPVVTYMSRNFFSRGVLNEGDILAYILARYNVTLRVTTFEEPLHMVLKSLGTTDIMFGMHGAGWTNGLFIKRGATTMQMFPYGWRLPDNSTLRGYNYREIVLASECPYIEWVNPVRENAFFRRSDYVKTTDGVYSLHPEPDMPLPTDGWPGNLWIYQNTYVDMNEFGPEIDAMFARSGIKPMFNDDEDQ